MFDVYFTTGLGKINTGVDIWVNNWLSEISNNLDTQPVLLIYRNKPKDFNFEIPIEHYWYNDENGNHKDIFEEKFKECRRVNILHAHYTPLELIEENLDKLHSYIIHNDLSKVYVQSGLSDSEIGWIPYYSKEWENKILVNAKNKVWVGLYDLTEDVFSGYENIQSYYDFEINKELSNSTKIGFTSRCESRKNPQYLSGLEGYMFMNVRAFQKTWRLENSLDFSKLKKIQYESEYSKTYYEMDWGISHSAFNAEPFGYSIFQNVDWGKLPILDKDWCPEITYPFRAGTKKEFVNIYRSIVDLSYEEKEKEFKSLKEQLINKFSTKQNWIQKLLKIYNG